MDPDPSVALREKLEGLLAGSYGSAPVDEDGDLYIQRDSIRVWLRPIPAGPDASLALIWTVSNVDVRVDEELTHFLATEGMNLTLPQFELHTTSPRPAVFESYALLGEDLSRPEMEVAVDEIVNAAREYGPRIQERFGGMIPGAPAAQPVQTPDAIADALRQATTVPGRPAPAITTRRPTRGTLVVRTILGVLGLAGGIWGGWYAWTRSHSLWLAAYVFLMTMWVVARGVADVITDTQKVRRALFFFVPPILSIAAVVATERLWGVMWLSTILGFFVALPLGIALSRAMFPRIALEEDLDTEERKRS